MNNLDSPIERVYGTLIKCWYCDRFSVVLSGDINNGFAGCPFCDSSNSVPIPTFLTDPRLTTEPRILKI